MCYFSHQDKWQIQAGDFTLGYTAAVICKLNCWGQRAWFAALPDLRPTLHWEVQIPGMSKQGSY